MRRTFALLLAFGLMLAPLALAKGGSDDREHDADDDRGRRHGGHGADDVADTNASSEDDEASDTRGRRGAHHAGTHDENETDDDDDDNATGRGHGKRATRALFVAQLRTSWLENATAIREACHAAAEPDGNATKEERLDRAHCIRDGYHAFFDALRELLRDLRASRRAASE